MTVSFFGSDRMLIKKTTPRPEKTMKTYLSATGPTGSNFGTFFGGIMRNSGDGVSHSHFYLANTTQSVFFYLCVFTVITQGLHPGHFYTFIVSGLITAAKLHHSLGHMWTLEQNHLNRSQSHESFQILMRKYHKRFTGDISPSRSCWIWPTYPAIVQQELAGLMRRIRHAGQRQYGLSIRCVSHGRCMLSRWWTETTHVLCSHNFKVIFLDYLHFTLL